MTTSQEIKSEVIFDAGDINYMVHHLGKFELQRVLRNHSVSRAFYLADRWPGSQYCSDYFFWFDLGRAAILALDILKSYEPKPKATPLGPGRRQPVDIEELKRRVDLVAIAGRETKLRRAGHNFTGPCPFHSERRPSFVVYPDRQTWHCFGACNRGGDVIAFVMKSQRLDFKGAIAFLSGGR